MRYNIQLGCPGVTFNFGAIKGILCVSKDHEVAVTNSGSGWDDFNTVWCTALNEFEKGNITHFAMLHSDISPEDGWLDKIIEEMDKHKVSLVSVPSPIKDVRGLTSSGIGDPDNRWMPYRRYTVKELLTMPETFTIAETEHPDKFLLHNTGCWACDLRDQRFFQTAANGHLEAMFAFDRSVYRDEQGFWRNQCESEDWYFSRKINDLGIPTAITRRVILTHRGGAEYPNSTAWGLYDHDVDTAKNWQKGEPACQTAST